MTEPSKTKFLIELYVGQTVFLGVRCERIGEDTLRIHPTDFAVLQAPYKHKNHPRGTVLILMEPERVYRELTYIRLHQYSQIIGSVTFKDVTIDTLTPAHNTFALTQFCKFRSKTND